MPKIKNWKKERDKYGITIWRNSVKRNLTVEIVSWKSQQNVDDVFYNWGYGYPAINGKGIPHTPEMFETKGEARKWAINYMKKHPNG